MFFNEIKLSKSAWHYKLQGFVFGDARPNLFSFCPYFWITIACLIIVVPVVVAKYTYRALKYAFTQPLLWMEKRAEEAFEDWINAIKEKDYFKFMERYGDYDNTVKVPKVRGDGRSDYGRRRMVWRELMKKKGFEIGSPEYHEYISSLQEKRDVRVKELRDLKNIQDQEWREYQANFIRRRDKILSFLFGWIPWILEGIARFFNAIGKAIINTTFIVKWTKRFLSTTLTVVFALGLALTMDYGYQWISGWDLHWYMFIPPLQIFGLVIGGLLILVPSALFFWEFCKWFFPWLGNHIEESYDSASFVYKFAHGIESVGLGIAYVFKTIWRFLKWMGRIIIMPFQFFIMYFQATKNDHCPAIIWDDEEEKS